MKPIICGDNAEIYIPQSGCSDCEQVEQELQEFKEEVSTSLEGKQNVLTAGENITITVNPETGKTIISATGGGGGSVTKEQILSALGYQEVEMSLTDQNGASTRWRIIGQEIV